MSFPAISRNFGMYVLLKTHIIFAGAGKCVWDLKVNFDTFFLVDIIKYRGAKALFWLKINDFLVISN